MITKYLPTAFFLAGLSFSAAKKIPYDLDLEARVPHVKKDDLKGSGGSIDVSKLLFNATQGDSTVDIAFFQAPPSCTNPEAEACNWTTQGVGIWNDKENRTELCCTPENFNQGLCGATREGRLVLAPHRFSYPDSYYQGDHSYVQLREGQEKSTWGWYNKHDTGSYVLMMINCGSNTSQVHVSGNLLWESLPKDPFSESVSLNADFENITDMCEIGLFDPENNEDPSAYITTIQELLEEFGAECSNEQATLFNNVLGAFETCAGFDLKEFIEDFPSAALGTIIECIVTTDWSSVSDWLDPWEIAKVDFSDRCLDFEFGTNAVGNGVRQLMLHPDRILPCFAQLSDDVPSCALETWPIPIVGGLLKPAACVAGHLGSILDDVLRIEMGIWDACLPHDGGCENECFYEGSLLVRGGNFSLPVSDTMERIAREEEFQAALSRYKQYKAECIEEWDGWKQYDGTDATEAGEDTTKNAQPEKDTSEGGISRGASVALSFLGGSLFGFALFAVASRWRARRVAVSHIAPEDASSWQARRAAVSHIAPEDVSQPWSTKSSNPPATGGADSQSQIV